MRNPTPPKTWTYKARIVYDIPSGDPTLYSTEERLIHTWGQARAYGVPRQACWHAEDSKPFPGVSNRIVVATWTAFA